MAMVDVPGGTQLEAVFQGHDARTAELAREIERLEDQASHLVRFLATGGDSPAVRAELRVIETTLAGLRAEWTTIEKASALPPPRVHPASSTTGERRAEISGRAKADSLLRDQEAVCLQVVPETVPPGSWQARSAGRHPLHRP
jgi:hypothetical protein